MPESTAQLAELWKLLKSQQASLTNDHLVELITTFTALRGKAWSLLRSRNPTKECLFELMQNVPSMRKSFWTTLQTMALENADLRTVAFMKYRPYSGLATEQLMQRSPSQEDLACILQCTSSVSLRREAARLLRESFSAKYPGTDDHEYLQWARENEYLALIIRFVPAMNWSAFKLLKSRAGNWRALQYVLRYRGQVRREVADILLTDDVLLTETLIHIVVFAESHSYEAAQKLMTKFDNGSIEGPYKKDALWAIIDHVPELRSKAITKLLALKLNQDDSKRLQVHLGTINQELSQTSAGNIMQLIRTCH